MCEIGHDAAEGDGATMLEQNAFRQGLKAIYNDDYDKYVEIPSVLELYTKIREVYQANLQPREGEGSVRLRVAGDAHGSV